MFGIVATRKADMHKWIQGHLVIHKASAYAPHLECRMIRDILIPQEALHPKGKY